jgi:hypothetical protein
MSRKKMRIAIAAIALSLAGAVSSAQAGSDQSEWRGGYHIGPFGQRLGGHRFRGLFAFAPRTTRHVHAYRHHRYYY